MSDSGAGVRDAVFLGVAVVLHGALFAVDPGLRWGASTAAEPVIPIEFVQAETSPFLAPIPPGDGRGSEMPDNGPGPIIIPKTSQPEPQAKPQLSVPKPKPAKPAGPSRAELDRRARIKAEKAKAKAEQVRVRAEQARVRAEVSRAKAEAARIARAEARQKKLELSRELAGLQNPDEAVTDGSAAPALAAAGGDRRSAASLEEGPSASSESDLRDSLNSQSQPMGGGVKRTEGSISWSIDGPIGTRRLLKRTLPVSPDWVSQRGLDLTVQVKFQVLEDGSVKQGAIIKVTSGFPELDRLADDAIKLWKFEAVPKQPASAPQTWGVVTFRFTMG